MAEDPCSPTSTHGDLSVIATGAFLAVGTPLAATVSSAHADEVKLLSALVMKPALAQMSCIFERTTGHKLTVAAWWQKVA